MSTRVATFWKITKNLESQGIRLGHGKIKEGQGISTWSQENFLGHNIFHSAVKKTKQKMPPQSFENWDSKKKWINMTSTYLSRYCKKSKGKLRKIGLENPESQGKSVLEKSGNPDRRKDKIKLTDFRLDLDVEMCSNSRRKKCEIVWQNFDVDLWSNFDRKKSESDQQNFDHKSTSK